MKIAKVHPRNRGWRWIAVAVIAGLFPLISWGSVSPAAAQSATTDPTKTSNAPSVNSNSSALSRRVLLPFVEGGGGGQNSPTMFGVQLYSDPSSESAALPLAKQAKVSWIRYPVRWAWIEPANTTPDQYRFGGLDWALAALPASGLNVIATVNENPSWAATYRNGPIDKTDISEFAQFMGALAERYDGDGKQDAPGSPVMDYWEFYNEPDRGDIVAAQYGGAYWGDFGAEYARMLCKVYPVMKAANPRAQIVFGGMAYDWFREDGGPFVRQFLDDVLAAGGGKCFDVMNFHYYPAFEAQWSSDGPGVLGKVNYMHRKLVEAGLGNLPMIITETGYHSNKDGTPETQAGYVVKLFTQSLAARLKVVIWFCWSDYDTAGYQFFNGLLDQNLQPKLAYYAYQVAAGKLGAAAFQRILTSNELPTGMQGYLFVRGEGGPLYVLWSEATSSQNVRLPGAAARVTDYVGNIAQVADDDDGQVDGRVTIRVGSHPVYVEVVS